jgi:spore germination cell wall hydrolase CwlJ-like protein
LKESDVTWLYGPLQTGGRALDPIHTEMNSGRISKSNSFIRKPILKKRSMSELMLQRSLSSSSLVKQAAAAVQAQQNDTGRRIRRPMLQRAQTDYLSFSFSSRRASMDHPNSRLSSITSSGVTSPSGERKHIHFNEQVAQCIAVDIKGDDDEEEDLDSDRYQYDSDDSDDGAIMMKRTMTKKRRPILKVITPNPGTNESKTIAMLPSTTLKYREDTPEPQDSALKHSTPIYRSPIMSPSSSQETLRPSKRSGKFFVADEDDEDDEAEGENQVNSPTMGWRSPTKYGESSSGFHRSASTGSLGSEPAGMRRTESGMFMPYVDGEAPTTTEGIFGRVIDTVNTARDIAHVIWNVGWRK